MGVPDYGVQFPDEENMTSRELSSFKRTAQIYNEWMQPLVKKVNIYHVLPRPDGVNWDGMEYIDPNTGKRLLKRYSDGSNPFKNYYKMLSKTSSEQYVFSADVRPNTMGIIYSTPRYGIFAGYEDDNKYVGACTLLQLVLTEKAWGLCILHCQQILITVFYHTLSVYRDGTTFILQFIRKIKIEVKKRENN